MDESVLEIVFGVAGGQIEEVEDVAVAEDACEVWRLVGLEEFGGEFGVGEASALEDAAVDLPMVSDRPKVNEFTGAIAFGGGELEVEQPLFLSFATGHDDAVMCPVQLRPQCGRNFRIGFVKLAHSLQVAPFKAFDAGFLGLDEGGKLLDRLLAPFGGFEPIADVLTDGLRPTGGNRPVELDQFLVGGGNDAALRGLDQRQDFGELGLESIGHGWFRIRSSGQSLPDRRFR